jgi:hypothetical protein
MSEADEIYAVPGWDSKEWDRVLLHRTDIGRAGCHGDWVFYRPGRLLVDARATKDERVRAALRAARAESADEPHVEIARALGLALFNAPDDRIVRLVAELRSAVPGAASLDHVLVAGPARWHGDDMPKPIGDPGDIPEATRRRAAA